MTHAFGCQHEHTFYPYERLFLTLVFSMKRLFPRLCCKRLSDGNRSLAGNDIRNATRYASIRAEISLITRITRQLHCLAEKLSEI